MRMCGFTGVRREACVDGARLCQLIAKCTAVRVHGMPHAQAAPIVFPTRFGVPPIPVGQKPHAARREA